MLALVIGIGLLCVLLPAIKAGHSLAPWVPSREEDVVAALDLAAARSGEVFYDLGCGDGRALFTASRRGLRTVGVELAPLPFFVAKLRALFTDVRPGSVAIRYGDLFKTNISDADIIFIYGLPRTLRSTVAAKLEREMKPGARVVSCHFRIRSWPEEATGYSAKQKNPVYLYEPN